MRARPASTPRSTTPPRLAPGTVVDGFELVRRLHRGGMASLWEVRCTPERADSLPNLGSEPMPLIMKVPLIRGGEAPAAIVGFEVEQMILPKLHGTHVPRFIAKGDFTHTPYIVMEHIIGASLGAQEERAPLPIEQLIEIGQRVACALQAVHQQHVVHLDIKPHNIMIRSNGEAVLVDFGLARHDHLPDLLEEDFTLPMGTAPYISPEQVQFVRHDPRSDIFALGAMLYQFATGVQPFGNPSHVAGLRKRLYLEPTPPRALRAELPPWLQELILRCLEVDPRNRYQSAAQLALDLQDPRQIEVTERASKLHTSGGLNTFKRWFSAVISEPAQTGSVSEQLDRGAVIMAAIDVQADAQLQAKLRSTLRRILEIEPRSRLACVGVLKSARIGMDTHTDKHGSNLHVKQLVHLKHWAHPLKQSLGLKESRLTFHVLAAPDVATAIVDFASRNQVDHIVMGARGNSRIRRYLGSVSSQVVAQAECSVTVVRTASMPPA